MQGLDTHDAYERLRESDFNDKQARGIVKVVKEAIAGEVATKTGRAELKSELKADIESLRAEIQALRTELAKQHTRLIVWVVSLCAIINGAIKALDFLS